ncbi:MAG: hypothetical protein IPM52_07060 [Bacteroidetes bacterium]|nr:hypothetical protein [Bacteroidota bacterium]
MKINHIIAIAAILLLWSCAHVPAYLPKLDNLGNSPNGAFVRLSQQAGPTVYGELLAVDSASIYVLTDKAFHNQSRCEAVPLQRVTTFKLRYAAPGRYGWSIPIYGLFVAPVTSGFLSIFTIPMNLIVTGSVTAGSYQATSYTNQDIRKADLWKFARYPQGLPDGIALSDIK